MLLSFLQMLLKLLLQYLESDMLLTLDVKNVEITIDALGRQALMSNGFHKHLQLNELGDAGVLVRDIATDYIHLQCSMITLTQAAATSS